MQLALLASAPEIAPGNARFWTQLDANCVDLKRIGRGVFAILNFGLGGASIISIIKALLVKELGHQIRDFEVVKI